MALTFEAEITPGMSTREVVDLARLAEEVGFDRLGISDVVLWPDCYVLVALVAQAADRIGIGPMVTNPYSRHPVVLARRWQPSRTRRRAACSSGSAWVRGSSCWG